MLMMATGAAAQQTVVNNQELEGKTVRRLVFDRENIKAVMSDGSTVENVKQMKATVVKTSGISSPRATDGDQGAWRRDAATYDLQGRRVSPATGRKKPAGVYVQKGKKKIQRP